MTSRERFHETLKFGKPDRLPLLDEGIREEVIKSWHKQGLPKETTISDHFLFDTSTEIDLEIFLPNMFSESSSLTKINSAVRKNYNKRKMSAIANKIIKKIIVEHQKDNITLLKVSQGLFLSLGINDWNSFTEFTSLMIEKPKMINDYMSIYHGLTGEILKLILSQTNVDAIIFAEPIGGNTGPLISPEMYEEFALTNYFLTMNIAKKSGIDNIIIRSYANIRNFLPLVVQYGFNCLWACETNSDDMDYNNIRKEFGLSLKLIGGIDLDILRKDSKFIQHEILNSMSKLIKEGGIIPLADGRIRADIMYGKYAIYRTLLEQLAKSI